MVSLKVGGSSPVSVEDGFVVTEGGCVVLYERGKMVKAGFTGNTMILAYCLAPRESVRLAKEGEYVVEF